MIIHRRVTLKMIFHSKNSAVDGFSQRKGNILIILMLLNSQKYPGRKRKSCVFCLSLINILMNRYSTSSVFLSFFERVCWLWSVYTDKSASKSTIVLISIWKRTQTCTHTYTNTHTHTHVQSSVKSKYGPEYNDNVEEENDSIQAKHFPYK